MKSGLVIAILGVVGALCISRWLFESCNDFWISTNITGLRHDLSTKLHGQHLVLDAVIKSINGHVKNPNPEKALVLSFHGTTGCGKNFVSRIIADNLYHKGMKSKYVHLINCPLEFPHEKLISAYQNKLIALIRDSGKSCHRNLFVFDEMDKMPPGLINTIKPFIDHYRQLEGVDYRKNIFIFLSNTGGKEINEYTFQHWDDGGDRESIKFKDMEQLLIRTAFNVDGGMWHTSLIDHHLISAFIPFLPLERRHVQKCIQDDLKAKGKQIKPEIIKDVLREMMYMPQKTKLFSTSGCKRVSEKVNLFAELYDD